MRCKINNKKIKQIFIVCTILLIVSGCMFFRTGNKRELAQNHLEQRYGGTFEFFSPFGVSYANPGVTEMLFRRESTIENILVQVRRLDDGTFEFRDNYFAVKFRQETENFIRSVASRVFNSEDIIVFYEVAKFTLSPNLSVNASFKEYITDSYSLFSATIVIPSEVYNEELSERLVIYFEEANVHGYIRLIAVNEDIFSLITDSNLGIGDIIVRRDYYRLVNVSFGS